MKRKRMLAYLLALCMALSPVLSSLNVYAAETTSVGTVTGNDVSADDNANAGVALLAETPGEAPEGAETFDGTDMGKWGFAGGDTNNLAQFISVAADSAGTNNYLQINTSERKGDWLASKTWDNMPLAMQTAEISFAWYTGTITSGNRAGYMGIRLQDGEKEILTLYLNDMRPEGKSPNESVLYYSTDGFSNRQATESSFRFNTWYDIGISLDFDSHSATITVDGIEVLNTAFSSDTFGVDTLTLGSFDVNTEEKVSFVASGIDNFLLDYSIGEEDFESSDIGKWGFSGGETNNLAQFISVAANSTGTNNYLQINTSERKGDWLATKEFSDVPDAMQAAEISFRWYTGTITSGNRAGFMGVRLQDGEKEIVTLYLNDMRPEGKSPNESALYYSMDGVSNRQATECVCRYNTWYDVKISIDFYEYVAKVYIDDNEVASIIIDNTVNNVTALTLGSFDLNAEEKVSFVASGIDDVGFVYIEDTNVDKEAIASLSEIADITVTKDEWATYSHPTTVTATLVNGNAVEVLIDQSSWISTPTFDEDVKCVYTWTANIVAPEGHANTNNLTVSYDLLYKVTTTSTHDYENDFTFDEDISGFKKWSKDYAGNDGEFNLSVNRDNDNLGYMKAEVSGDGDRGSILDVPGFASETVKNATVEFDWKPMSCNNNAVGGQVLFVAPEQFHSYFTLRFDKNYNLFYYTKTPVSNKTVQKEFEGIIADANAVSTGLGGQNKWFTVKVEFDYVGHTADLTIKEKGNETNAYTETGIPIEKEANGLKTFLIHMDRGSNGASVSMGLDNLKIDYTILGASDITAVGTLSDVQVTQEQWSTYSHPQSIEVTLGDGSKTSVPLTGWTAEPAFDEDKAGIYTWTGSLVPGELSNMFGLTATYRMSYVLSDESAHDYENTFDISNDIAGFQAWGKEMDSTSGTGAFTVSALLDNANNGYLKAKVSGGGERGSRLDINNSIVKGAEITFDWQPVSINENANGQLMFLAPGSWHPYFTLRADKDNKLYYFTENPLALCATQQKAFEGSIDADNAEDTGLSGDNWYTVNIKFDYLSHTADLTITAKDSDAEPFTKTGIPIETEANGLKSFVIHMNKISGTASVEMNIDNIVVDYDEFSAKDIISIQQPADVKVAAVAYDDYVFPTEVTATLGDLSTVNISLGDWTATPDFDEETEAVYTWTAPLINGEYTNLFQLEAEFDMDYTKLPFPLYVHNPNTVELEFGESMPTEFPTEVVAFMSDGTTGTMAVSEWTAIREFNPDEEGIYVYGANLVETEGKDQIVREQLNRNENHDDHGSDRDKYVYDVYYRISYFETEDNYNAYTRSMEYLDRGVYAVAADNGIFVSWRLLATEYGEDVSFNIYRNGELVNSQPITSKTNYVDVNGKAGDSYTVIKLQDGLRYESEAFVAIDKGYMSIPMQKPDPQPSVTGEMAEYTLNDAGVADVDGDGQYEVIVKWYPTNSFDSGKAVKPSSPTIFDVYEMDGTPLWRLNLGLEMPSGAHFNQFMFYDLDEDGKAELFLKTSDGAITYKPNAEGKFDMTDESTIVSYIGDKSVVPGSNVNPNGHVSAASNEYVTVFNGMTGEEIDTINYVNTTGLYSDWHAEGDDDGGNRSARYNIAIAYLPKEAGSTETIPAVLLNRGYYAKTTVAAYTLRDGELGLEWNFVVESDQTGDGGNAGKGNHNMSTGDVDNDGFDELVIGALALDHDGTVLWSKDAEDGRDFSGHADAIHLAAMTPDSNQLYVMVPSEEKPSTLNYSVTNAATGARIAGQFMAKADIGRGVAANVTPLAGFEYWANVPNSEIANQAPSGAIYNFYGDVISQEKPVNFTTNWRMYWDGDLLSELPDSYNPSVAEGAMSVFKYNWEDNTMDTLVTFSGTKLNNSTKNNPSLTADLFGDWREEVMLRSEDSTELRIYMTSEETDYMIYTLMHDPVYRNCIANQNTAYNQPPQLGFYLGEDIKDKVLAMELPTSKIAYTVEEPEGTEEPKDPVESPKPTNEPTSAPEVTSAPTSAPEVTSAPTSAPEVTSAPTNAPVVTSEPTSAPVVTSAPSSGSSSSGSSAPSVSVNWNQISVDLSTQEERQGANTNMNVTVGNNIVVPANTLATLVNENVTLALHTGNGVTFSLSSQDVTRNALDGSMNLSVAPGNLRVPAGQLASRLEGTLANTQISMVSDDSFGMTVNLHVSLGAQHAGRYANLYGYNEVTGRLEYRGSFRITENGQAMFGLSRGNEYLVTVTNTMPNEAVVGDGYIVRAGDTLSRIASRYRIPLSRLVELNPDIQNINRIYVGQNIRVH